MIKTWQQRCEEHPDHEGIVTEQMIRDRMQEEIDELRQALAKQKKEWVGLTDEDKEGIKNKATYNWDTTAGEYASEVQALTEAKLKEKNVPQP